MYKIIGPLSNPVAHGGDPHDAFHVVAPSLPGYGFSDAATQPGMSMAKVADVWAGLMTALNYDRFGSHGSDWGSGVTMELGVRHPERMTGLHVTAVFPPFDPAKLHGEQREWWLGVQRYRDEEWGYQHIQRTRPQTASFALTDSPVGLAAWILEKWWRWSDCIDADGNRVIERAFTKDELLTNVMLYWVTRSIGPSMRLYFETLGTGGSFDQPQQVAVPFGAALFKEAHRPPRELAEPFYDIRRWTEIDKGGHFPALENPDALVEEIRAFYRPLRVAG
jgi:pimeloyl-ACP methyl ester carboxylesterase